MKKVFSYGLYIYHVLTFRTFKQNKQSHGRRLDMVHDIVLKFGKEMHLAMKRYSGKGSFHPFLKKYFPSMSDKILFSAKLV